MKFIKWKFLIVTSLVCLLPILFGLAFWTQLPDTIAVHFNVYGEPDNFASKGFAVFGLPLLMAALQWVCCFINDIDIHKYGERKKFERVTKWILPGMTVILQGSLLGYALGWGIDITKVAPFIVGTVFLMIGNYLPKFDYIKNYDLDTEKARKINRFIGIESIIMGVLSFACIFLPPQSLLIWLLLLIPYTIISIVYGITVGRRK